MSGQTATRSDGFDWADAEPYAWWPPHGSERACHEGECARCELERERDEAEGGY